MKMKFKITIVLLLTLLVSCGGDKNDKKKEKFSYQKKSTTEQTSKTKTEKIPASKKIDLINKGVGPIQSITLTENIDKKMAASGAEVYKKMCTACHRVDKKFIGPAPKGILKRRTPEWIMNMILDPEKMVKEDALAKELLWEFNGSPMINQGITEKDARAILEYFRTLE
ncbi:MAG: c-type cytochrome [Lacinutrix venerupis]